MRSKSYSMIIYDRQNEKLIEKNAAAGVSKPVARKLGHDVFKETLFSQKDHYITQSTIRSFSHNLYTVEQHKAGLTAYDDKRYLCTDNISTRAHGHYLNE